jgi:hypothetical protein
VNGKLNVVTFDQAFGAESESERMIPALADRLCDDEPFLDEESGQKFVVIFVERNADPDLVIKGKPHLKFNGLVAWALPVDGSKWRTKLTAACKCDTIWRYRECVPMDPSDFDIIRHCIPFIPSETPGKKRVKRDPEDLSPEKIWKPSLESKRAMKGRNTDTMVQEFFKEKIANCALFDVPCPACVWLYKALNTACLVSGTDFRYCMETALEWASVPDITRAIFFVLKIDIDLPREKTMSKSNFLRKCIDFCICIAEKN